MEYFLKENKKYLIAVILGVVVFFVYQGVVLSPIRNAAEAAARKRKQEKADLEKKLQAGVPSDETLVMAPRDRDLNQKTLSVMVSDVAFKAPERYKVPDKVRPKTHYDDEKLNLAAELKKKAGDGKLDLPQNLVLPDADTDESVPDLLLRLAMVERLVTVAIESEVPKIDTIDALYGVDPTDRGGKKPQFLTRYTIFMKFSGKAETVFKVLHGAQKKGSYLAVTHFDMSRPDATKEVFDASIAVTLLKVDEKAPVEAR